MPMVDLSKLGKRGERSCSAGLGLRLVARGYKDRQSRGPFIFRSLRIPNTQTCGPHTQDFGLKAILIGIWHLGGLSTRPNT